LTLPSENHRAGKPDNPAHKELLLPGQNYVFVLVLNMKKGELKPERQERTDVLRERLPAFATPPTSMFPTWHGSSSKKNRLGNPSLLSHQDLAVRLKLG
jgi:hypothetical protein